MEKTGTATKKWRKLLKTTIPPLDSIAGLSDAVIDNVIAYACAFKKK